MPWSREEGAVLAQTVMDGDYRLRPLSSTSRKGEACWIYCGTVTAILHR